MLIKHLLLTPILLFWAFSINAQITTDSSFTDSIGLCWKGKTENGKMTGLWTGSDCKLNQVIFRTNYKNHMKNGSETIIDMDGSPVTIYFFNNGLRNGTASIFSRETRKKIGEVNYANDTIHGTCSIYNHQGKLLQTSVWEKGKPVSVKPETDLGKLVPPPLKYVPFEQMINKLENPQLYPPDEIQNLSAKAGADSLTYDTPPEFPGGLYAFMLYIQQNLRYPEQAKKKGIGGKIFMEFDVETDGTITNIRVKKGIPEAPDLEKEAMRVISEMPKWKPALRKGIPVKSTSAVPVQFVIL
jgi:TonB family protein